MSSGPLSGVLPGLISCIETLRAGRFCPHRFLFTAAEPAGRDGALAT